MGVIATAIKQKLTKNFNPSHLEVIDQSHLHAGHAGAAAHAAEFGEKEGSAESHFHVIIAAEALKPLSRLARHRAVMEALDDEMPKIHAFSLEVKT